VFIEIRLTATPLLKYSYEYAVVILYLAVHPYILPFHFPMVTSCSKLYILRLIQSLIVSSFYAGAEVILSPAASITYTVLFILLIYIWTLD
jgi:hypothetical protein